MISMTKVVLFLILSVALSRVMTSVVAAPVLQPQTQLNTSQLNPPNFVYIANLTGGSVTCYGVGKEGQLAPLSPNTVLCGPRPTSLTVNSEQDHLYVTNSGDNTISLFHILHSGSLQPVGTDRFRSHGLIISLAVLHTKSYACILTRNGNGNYAIEEHSVLNDGSLESIAKSNTTLTAPSLTIAVDSTDRYLYALSKGEIAPYQIDDNGGLTPLPKIGLDSSLLPTAIYFLPATNFAYVLSYSGTILQFSMTRTGQLVPLVPASIRQIPSATALSFSPLSNFAYVVDKVGSIIYEYSVGASGKLVRLHPLLIPANQSLDKVANR